MHYFLAIDIYGDIPQMYANSCAVYGLSPPSVPPIATRQSHLQSISNNCTDYNLFRFRVG